MATGRAKSSVSCPSTTEYSHQHLHGASQTDSSAVPQGPQKQHRQVCNFSPGHIPSQAPWQRNASFQSVLIVSGLSALPETSPKLAGQCGFLSLLKVISSCCGCPNQLVTHK